MTKEGQKRKHDGGADGAAKKRGKGTYFSHNKFAAIPIGSRGFLISCVGGKEWQAGREAISVLSELYEAAAPADENLTTVVPEAEPEHADAPTDIAAALAAEVADLKDVKKQLFTYHSTKVTGLLFLSMSPEAKGPGPVELATKAARHAKSTRELKTRLCMRFLPIEKVCYGSIEDISKMSAPLIAQHFPGGEGAQAIEFSVAYEHRASVTMDRMEVINAIVNQIPKPPHKVNLDAPSKTVIVQLVKASCGISIVDDYKELLRFNLRELATGQQCLDKPKRQAPKTKPKQAADGKAEDVAPQGAMANEPADKLAGVQSQTKQEAQEEGAAAAAAERQQPQDGEANPSEPQQPEAQAKAAAEVEEPAATTQAGALASQQQAAKETAPQAQV